MSHELPSQFPMGEVFELTKFIRKDPSVTVQAALSDAWWIAGFGLSLVPTGALPVTTRPLMSTQECQAALLAHLEVMGGMKAGEDQKALPWATILPLLLQLITTFLK